MDGTGGTPSHCRLPVVVTTPAHSGLGASLSYRATSAHPPGTLVRVPLGSREVLGIVWDNTDDDDTPEAQLRDVLQVFDSLPP